MKFTHLIALFAAAAACFLMSACGGEPEVTSGTEDGVTVVKQTEMDLRVVATDGDAKVTIVVHRNGLRDPATIHDRTLESPYDADIIVRNRYGAPFVASGNHGLPGDPDTGTKLETSSGVVRQNEQLEDLRLAVAVAEDLKGRDGLHAEFYGEIRNLHSMTTRALEGANDMIDGKIVPEPTLNEQDIPQALLQPGTVAAGAKAKGESSEGTPDANTAVATQAFTAPYTHRVTIRYYPSFWAFGDHSAVLLEVFDSLGAFVGQVSTRNHGGEATDPLLGNSVNCPKSWTGRTNQYPPLQPYVSTDTYNQGDAGGCNTQYDLVWPTNGHHVCNDDSLAQYYNVKYNANASWATCGDSTLRQWAPYCE